MKQLVGLLNYFRDFCQHHSQIMKPSWHDPQLPKENQGRAPAWTEEGLTFDRIIEEVAKNHKMFFPRRFALFSFKTDASDYGIGAYCFQLVDNVEQPVAFVSKISRPLNISGQIHKRGILMFYAFRQLKTILRDRPFTVQTDSRGFRFMRNDSNPMVYRWLVDTQEYDFKLEDILGINNLLRMVYHVYRIWHRQGVFYPGTYTWILIHNDRESPQRSLRTTVWNVWLRMLTTPTSKNSKVTLLRRTSTFLDHTVKTVH
jgi:hypothetical protein